jgi:hypothetical protein
VRCTSVGAERPECGLRAGPAYVVTPPEQAKKKEKKVRANAPRSLPVHCSKPAF